MQNVTTWIDSFGTKAADAAMLGAADYLKAHAAERIAARTLDYGRLTDILKARIPAAVNRTLDEHRALLVAGTVSGDLLAADFLATMALEGIAAAKAFLAEKGGAA